MSSLEYIAIFILLFDFTFHVKSDNTAVAEHCSRKRPDEDNSLRTLREKMPTN